MADVAMPSSSDRSSASHAVGLLLIVGGLLAVTTIFAKAAPRVGWSPIVMLQWAFLGSAVLQGGLLTFQQILESGGQGGSTQTRASNWELAAYLGVAGLLFALPSALSFAAAPHVGAGFMSLCFAFPLVLTYGFSVLLKLEQVAVLRVVGVASGVLGGVLLATAGRNFAPEAQGWALAALMVPVILAVGNIYRTVKWPKGVSNLALSTGMGVVGFCVLWVATNLWGLPQRPQQLTGAAIGLLVAQSLVFAFQYVLSFQLQKLAGPVYLSQIGSVAAVLGLGLAYLVFQEVPGLLQMAAVAAIGIGIFCVSWKR